MDTSKYKILIVDDEKDVREILEYNISKAGYNVFTAENGKIALDIIKKENPHLIILDVMMPIIDGYETCIEIRKLPNSKKSIVVFLSARNDDHSQIIGFDAGGDDYVTKPVNPKVLLKRIKALLKRNNFIEKDDDNILTYKEYKLNKVEYTLLKNNTEIILPKKQFEILRLLFSQPNHVFSRDEIFEAIWGDGVIVGSRTIDVHIRKIREKTGIEKIKTMKGIGYKLEQ
ncbi:MAG: response regulator transcription factor [Chlorobi bacterium]|nr:response regulator transcription factor [Chlorobiota bacterium]